MNTYNLVDLVNLIKELKTQRQQGTEYISLGTSYDNMVQIMIEEGWEWTTLKRVTDVAYAAADYGY